MKWMEGRVELGVLLEVEGRVDPWLLVWLGTVGGRAGLFKIGEANAGRGAAVLDGVEHVGPKESSEPL